MDNLEPLLKAKDVKNALGVSMALVYKLAASGALPCVRWESPGNGTRKKTVVRFKKADVLNFIEENYK